MMNGLAIYLPKKMLFTGVLILLSIQLVTCKKEWDNFRFAQAWPPGTCADAPKAAISGESKGPVSCNNTWKFNFTKIKNLEPLLDVYWPNIHSDTSHSSFWAHEWEKHGTCCADLAATAGEMNYFRAGLNLNKKYNISKMLSDSNINPSETVQYSYDDFVGAVKKAIGYEPILKCTTRKQENGLTYHLIDQVKICLNKDFTPRSCTDGTYYPSGFYSSNGDNSLKDFEKAVKNDVIGRRYIHHSHASCPKKFNYPPIHEI